MPAAINDRLTAIMMFKRLCRLYGIRWDAKVPREAYDTLARCNEFLTEDDRRKALFY